mmetsp:Transcript_131888/g.186093  ORF Transcript_131888/g.186093 Transcript_131888/m.186093 type:complete len:143 (+) Transcript_131888:69-497(+)
MNRQPFDQSMNQAPLVFIGATGSCGDDLGKFSLHNHHHRNGCNSGETCWSNPSVIESTRQLLDSFQTRRGSESSTSSSLCLNKQKNSPGDELLRALLPPSQASGDLWGVDSLQSILDDDDDLLLSELEQVTQPSKRTQPNQF